MTKRLGSSNRRRGRKAKREVEDRLGDIPRSDIDAVVAEAFDATKPTQEIPTPTPTEIALDEESGSKLTGHRPVATDLPAKPVPEEAPKGFGEEIGNRQSQIQNPPEPLPARMLNEFVYCPRL